MRKRIILFAAIGVAGLVKANAGETAIPVTPPGGTDLSQALLPPPGFYGGLITIPFNRNENLFGFNGKPVPPQKT
jgi:hypothetical protein